VGVVVGVYSKQSDCDQFLTLNQFLTLMLITPRCHLVISAVIQLEWNSDIHCHTHWLEHRSLIMSFDLVVKG